MKLFGFSFEGAYLGGSAIIWAPDDEAARGALLNRLIHKEWPPEKAVSTASAATIHQIMLPNFTSILFFNDGDY